MTDTDNKISQPLQVSSLMAWVRVLLPVVIAGIGWYVGTTIGSFDSRLTRVEEGLNGQKIEFVGHIFESNADKREMQRRLNNLDAIHIRDNANRVNKDDYLRERGELLSRIDALEKKTR